MTAHMAMRRQVQAYCAQIGSDPLLVQGAGGNVSWKEDGMLWIKASGTWLADALAKDIFVAVDLPHLRQALADGDWSATPRTAGQSTLRPSIETMLHALMPQPVVVHVHAIEILAHLVRPDFAAALPALLGDGIRWAATGYHKPGAALAQAVAAALAAKPGAQVVFLGNHGVVLGADGTQQMDGLLRHLLAALSTEPRPPSTQPAPAAPVGLGAGLDHMPQGMQDSKQDGKQDGKQDSIQNGMQDARPQWHPLAGHAIHSLATDPALFARLETDWVLYPDHAVFLGPKPACFDSLAALHALPKPAAGWPELVFVRGLGVFACPQFGLAKQAQLRCYHDVLARQDGCQALQSLGSAQIAELLDWDAERYRMHLAK